MRIGLYTPYLDDVGGGEKYMLTIAEILSLENEVKIFWDNKEDLEIAQKRFSLDLSNVEIVRNVFTPETSFFKRFKESKKYDAIIILSDGSLPIVASKLFVHFQSPLEHVRISLMTKFKKKRIASFFCNSKYTKSYIDKTFEINSEVVYPPVDLHPKKIKKENIIMHVGRFRVVDKTVGIQDFKKQYVMLQVFKDLVDEGLKNWKLIMAVSVMDQDKEIFTEMKNDVKSYPVEFIVNKTNAELWEWYSKAKIYWHASGYGEDLSIHPEAAEHFGISTVEAMGAGAVPVVVNLGGQKEIITDESNGYLWDTLDQFKEKTLLLARSEKLLHDLSGKAVKRADDFSKEAFKKHIQEMISENSR